MNQNPHWKQLIWNWASIIFGNALYSLAVALFLEPAGLITGGATGIALAIGRLTGLPVSGLLFFINLAMLVWGWVVLGRAFALNTLASSVLSPAFLALFEGMANGRVLTEDIILCTVFAGLGIGVSLGIVLRYGAGRLIFGRPCLPAAGAQHRVLAAGGGHHAGFRLHGPADAGCVQPDAAGAVRHCDGAHPHRRHG